MNRFFKTLVPVINGESQLIAQGEHKGSFRVNKSHPKRVSFRKQSNNVDYFKIEEMPENEWIVYKEQVSKLNGYTVSTEGEYNSI